MMRLPRIESQKLLLPSHNCVRKMPVNYQESDRFRFENDFERPTYDVYSYQLEPLLVTAEGVLMDKRGIVQPLTILQYLSPYSWKYWLKKYWVLPRQSIQETAVFCFDEWSKGLFHWFCDVLPKLMCLREHAPSSILLLPTAPQAFHLESIKPFGFKQTLSVDRKKSVWADKGLITVSEIAITGNYHYQLMRDMRQLFNQYFPLNPALNLGDKIYASRARARRKLANEHELEPVLAKHGFRKVFLEDYSFVEQLSIVRHAKYFAAVHGASLAYMSFMPAETRILEIRNETDTHNLCYFALATDMAQAYYYALAKPTTPSEGNHSDLVLEASYLDHVLNDFTKP
ncbi:MAG: glycosyltransferase family 61 protein [Cytophagales bacterium]|nr:MAG: glycosyltransferase family 61 protein [Cytophagales bacterium]TAF60118.1 MAG: glycosyltransferase family 61 protein [Cytophagales bacterium]